MINDVLIKTELRFFLPIYRYNRPIFKIVYFQLRVYRFDRTYKWLWLNVIEYVLDALSLV